MNRQKRKGPEQQPDVHTRLQPYVPQRSQRVGVGITRQQAGLEEQQTTGPNSRPAAKPWQDVTPDHGLHLEQKKGAQKYRDGKENMIRWEVN
jgi:hypothetical protein